jgi:hypothetical protein
VSSARGTKSDRIRLNNKAEFTVLGEEEMKTLKILFFLFLVLLFLPAWLPDVQAETPPPVYPTPQNAPIFPPTAAWEAQKALSKSLGIGVERTTITMIANARWSDGCLGLASANELCSQNVVTGYRVVLRANGRLYEYHTDSTGSLLRAAW